MHLRRRRPDEPLQRQRRRAEDADPAPDPLGDLVRRSSTADVDTTLQAILDTEITPELVPAGADGSVQSTEGTIGPYALHDFTLFHVLRYGSRPSKVAFLAWHAWRDVDAGDWPHALPRGEEDGVRPGDDPRVARRVLPRFFGFSQFKRSAMPNGPKVSAGGSLSPRGDWRAPSDTAATTWLAELEANVPHEL